MANGVEWLREEAQFHDRIADQYSDLMKHYLPYNMARNLKRVKDIAQQAGQFTRPKILDVGCGNGYVLAPLMESIRDGHFYGIDISHGMIEATKRRIPKNGFCKLQVADATHLPFKEGAFDLIFCIATLHHLPNIESALNEFNRVLKEGGYLYLEEPSSNILLDLLRRLRHKGKSSPHESSGFALAFLPDKVRGSKFSVERYESFQFLAPLAKQISSEKVIKLILNFERLLQKLPLLCRLGLNIRLWAIKTATVSAN